MKRNAIFLQIIIIFIGIAAVALLLWEPHLEGRNVNSTLFEIYFNDPFLAYAYIASIPFFASLYQAHKILGYVGQDKIFTQDSIKALRTIKYFTLSIIGFAIIGMIIIMFNNSDDHNGGLFIGMLIIIGSLVIGAASEMFERILQNELNMLAGKDLIE